MGNLPGAHGNEAGGVDLFLFQPELEFEELGWRNGVQKAFEDDEAFAKAGIEVIVVGVEDLPIPVGIKAVTFPQIVDGGQEIRPEIFDEVGKGVRFKQELSFLRQQDLGKDVVLTGSALTLGIEKIGRVQSLQIGGRAVLISVRAHGVKKLQERLGQSLA